MTKMGKLSVIALLIMVIAVGMTKSSPIPLPEKTAKNVRGSDKPKDFISIVFLTCSNKGKHEISIEPGSTRCININLDGSTDGVSMTKPEGLKLRIFEKKDCDGTSILYNPVPSQKFPFEINSFLIYNEEEIH